MKNDEAFHDNDSQVEGASEVVLNGIYAVEELASILEEVRNGNLALEVIRCGECVHMEKHQKDFVGVLSGKLLMVWAMKDFVIMERGEIKNEL